MCYGVVACVYLLCYHRRLRLALRSARAARGRQTSYSQYVHGYGGSRDGDGGWYACGATRTLGDAGAVPECEVIH